MTIYNHAVAKKKLGGVVWRRRLKLIFLLVGSNGAKKYAAF